MVTFEACVNLFQIGFRGNIHGEKSRRKRICSSSLYHEPLDVTRESYDG
jgi:hypothetical protein